MPVDLDHVVAVDAGHEFAMALRDDGHLIAWGSFQAADDRVYPATVPPGLDEVVGMDCGAYHALALRADGSVVAWGENDFGQIDVPPGLMGVIAVAAGANHSLVAWGGNTMGQCNVPPNVRYAYAIVAASQRSVALVDDALPCCSVRPVAVTWHQGTLALTLPALRGQAFFLERKWTLEEPV